MEFPVGLAEVADAAVVGDVDVDALEEGLVEASPHLRRASRVGVVGVLGEFERQGDAGLDEPELGAGGLDGLFDLGELSGDAVLFVLEQVEGHRTGEVGSYEGDSLVLEPLAPLGGRAQLGSGVGVLLADALDQLRAQADEVLTGELYVGPDSCDRFLDRVDSDVPDRAVPAVLMSHALEVVVRAAASAVA